MTDSAIENKAKTLNSDNTEEQTLLSKNIRKNFLLWVIRKNAKEHHRRHTHSHQFANGESR